MFIPHASGWEQLIHATHPNEYSLWVNLHFLMICMYKHCFLPMLLVFAMKYCIKMPCSLPHNHYCCLLPSPACLTHLLICTCLNSSPIACPPSSVLCRCLHPLLAHLHLRYVVVYCFFVLFFVLHTNVFHFSLFFVIFDAMVLVLLKIRN